jgi:hypothetical protein
MVRTSSSPWIKLACSHIANNAIAACPSPDRFLTDTPQARAGDHAHVALGALKPEASLYSIELILSH